MDDEKLISDLSNWRKYNGKDFSVEDWIVGEGNVNFAIAYTFIFWPEFLEYDDCIIFKNHFDKTNFENWKNLEYIKSYA